jgi:hypothetical protein
MGNQRGVFATSVLGCSSTVILTPIEKAAALRLIRDHGLPAFCRALFNANEFLFVN